MRDPQAPIATSESPQLCGVLAEFETVDALLAAARRVREAGFARWDAHVPFPVHGLDEAMGIRRTRLPWIVLGCGLTGVLVGLGLQWWTNAVDYPFLISGKPLFSWPANVPVIFELGVLFAAMGAFLGMLVLNRLPEWYHPVLTSERFRRATSDRFFIVIDADDPCFDRRGTSELLEAVGGTVEFLEA